MKKIVKNKYFIAIGLIVLAIANGILFLTIDKDCLKLGTFWFNYSFGMGAYLLMILTGLLLSLREDYKLNIATLYVMPIFFIIFIISLVLMFFITKLQIVFLAVMYIALLGVGAITFVFALMYQSHLNNIPVKNVEIVDNEGFIACLNELKQSSTDKNVIATLNKLLELANMMKDTTNEEKEPLEQRMYEILGFMKKDLTARSNTNFFYNASRLQKLLERRVTL